MERIHDLHNHLLPNVDDGCRTLSETLHYLRAFHEQGVSDLVFTPHLLAADLERPSIEAALVLHRARFDDVLRAIDGDASFPRVRLGQEILARNGDDIEKVVARDDVGLGAGPVLLVEFGFRAGFDGEDVIRRVKAEGRQIVVAHPERYAWGSADPVSEVGWWRDLGATIQVNGGSLAGLYSSTNCDLAWRLLDADLIDLVSSDHHGDARPHDPGLYANYIARRAGAATVARLIGAGPRAIMAGMGRVGAADVV